jgi:hypothetical protein
MKRQHWQDWVTFLGFSAVASIMRNAVLFGGAIIVCASWALREEQRDGQ